MKVGKKPKKMENTANEKKKINKIRKGIKASKRINAIKSSWSKMNLWRKVFNKGNSPSKKRKIQNVSQSFEDQNLQVSKRSKIIEKKISQEYFLQDMPDEVLLKTFRNLNLKDLLRCAQTSKRINAICNDISLWTQLKLNASKFPHKKIPSKILKKALKNGCKKLSLREVSVLGGSLNLESPSHLECLDLAFYNVGKEMERSNQNDEVLKELLDSCYTLQKLSLVMNLKKVFYQNIWFQNGQTLRVLDLAGLRGLTLMSMQQIIDNCVELSEVNFLGTRLSDDSIDYLADNLTSKVVRLGLSYENVKNNHVKTLVSRCQLEALDLTCTTQITNEALSSIIEHLAPSLKELDLRSTNIDIYKLLDLRSMKKLKVFNQDRTRDDKDKEYLKQQLPNVKINQEPIIIATTHMNETVDQGRANFNFGFYANVVRLVPKTEELF